MPKPNILILMIDGAQGRLFEPGSPCRTPQLDALAATGVRVTRAYAPNPICSPSRASLMTGLLPHNHGVLDVIHSAPEDQCCLRTDKPHWAQRLVAAGYRTGYFGKWHVERSLDLARFGWQVNGTTDGEYYQERVKISGGGDQNQTYAPGKTVAWPEGYKQSLLYGVVAEPAALRGPGRTTAQANLFLQESLTSDQPWCCFVSLSEPNEPPLCGRGAFDSYALDKIQLPATQNDDLAGRPGLYRKAAGLWNQLSDREKRELLASQYASITEIDALFGQLLARVDQSDAAANTIVIFTSDHGNLLGAHGLIAHNTGGFEENYHIPMIVRGPGLPAGAVQPGVVSLHDLGDTLLDLCGLPLLGSADSKSFAPLLQTHSQARTAKTQTPAGVSPTPAADGFNTAYAEFFGARYRLTQRVLWDGTWKFVFNGFDQDELYDLKNDPQELHNLAGEPAHQARAQTLMAQVWQKIRDTGDTTLWESHWPGLRWAIRGPLSAPPAAKA